MGKINKMLGHNAFAYCRNNPISRYDLDGFEDFSAVLIRRFAEADAVVPHWMKPSSETVRDWVDFGNEIHNASMGLLRRFGPSYFEMMNEIGRSTDIYVGAGIGIGGKFGMDIPIPDAPMSLNFIGKMDYVAFQKTGTNYALGRSGEVAVSITSGPGKVGKKVAIFHPYFSPVCIGRHTDGPGLLSCPATIATSNIGRPKTTFGMSTGVYKGPGASANFSVDVSRVYRALAGFWKNLFGIK